MGIKMYGQNDKLFEMACSLADVKTTKRQYGKWLKGEGMSSTKKDEAREKLSPKSKEAS